MAGEIPTLEEGLAIVVERASALWNQPPRAADPVPGGGNIERLKPEFHGLVVPDDVRTVVGFEWDLGIVIFERPTMVDSFMSNWVANGIDIGGVGEPDLSIIGLGARTSKPVSPLGVWQDFSGPQVGVAFPSWRSAIWAWAEILQLAIDRDQFFEGSAWEPSDMTLRYIWLSVIEYQHSDDFERSFYTEFVPAVLELKNRIIAADPEPAIEVNGQRILSWTSELPDDWRSALEAYAEP